MKRVIIYLIQMQLVLMVCSCDKHLETLKEQRCYEHPIENGVISEKGQLKTVKKFNSNGRIIEEDNTFNSGDSASRVTIYRYNNSNYLIEKVIYENGTIQYKKILEYNGGKLISKRIFFGRDRNSTELLLWASVNYYYNSSGQLSYKRFIGGIDELDNETMLTVNEQENLYNQIDSNLVRYSYGENGQLDSIRLEFHPDRSKSAINSKLDSIFKLLVPICKIHKYTYVNDSLLSKIWIGRLFYDQKKEISKEVETEIGFKYFGNALIEETAQTSNSNQITRYMNRLKTEIIWFDKDKGRIESRTLNKYDENGSLIETTEYNYLNEPIKHFSYENEY